MMVSWATTVSITHLRPEDQSVMVAGSMIFGAGAVGGASGIFLMEG